jgi:hypothetical protein
MIVVMWKIIGIGISVLGTTILTEVQQFWSYAQFFSQSVLARDLENNKTKWPNLIDFCRVWSILSPLTDLFPLVLHKKTLQTFFHKPKVKWVL